MTIKYYCFTSATQTNKVSPSKKQQSPYFKSSPMCQPLQYMTGFIPYSREVAVRRLAALI